MSEPNDNVNERLDDLLRRWGAREAAHDADAEHLPAPVPAPARRPARLRRWLAAAAALVLVAGLSAVVTIATTRWWGSTGDVFRALPVMAPPPGAEPEPAGRAADRDAADTELADARQLIARQAEHLAAYERQARDWQKAEADYARRLAGLNDDVKQLSATLRRAESAQRTTGTRLAALKTQVAQAERRAAGAAARADGLGRETGRLSRELTGARTDLEAMRGEWAAASARVKQRDADIAALRERTADQVARLQAQHVALTRMCQRSYLAASAPGETGLRARQVAARSSRLLARGGRLQNAVRQRTTRKLFDTLEVLLTRLDLLDPDDAAARRSFAALLQRTKPSGEIQRALGAGGEEPAVRDWLLETRLVLMGL